MPFLGAYLKYGMQCMVGHNPNPPPKTDEEVYSDCSTAYLWIIGYTISLSALQLSLFSLMQYKRAANTRMIFASAVPITVMAFYLGSFSLHAALFDLREF